MKALFAEVKMVKCPSVTETIYLLGGLAVRTCIVLYFRML